MKSQRRRLSTTSSDPEPAATFAPSRDEAQLLRQLRAGDESAFTTLVGRHHTSMVRLARGYVRSDAVAEEVAQEAWLGLLRGLDGFEERSSLRTWLLRIVVNRAISTGVRERVHLPVSDSELEADNGRFSQDGWWVAPPTHWADEALDRMVASQLAARVKEFIDELPQAQRTVVTLRDVEGLTSEQVCTILEISEGNQRVLLHRARARLRSRLEEEVQS